VDDPTAWYAADYQHLENYIYRLTPLDVEELDAAIATASSTGKDLKV
jgi:hypothetical protein